MVKTMNVQEETAEVFEAPQVVAAGFVEDTSDPAPKEVLGRQEIQQIISQEMAQSLVAMLPALLPELVKGMQIQGPNGPSQNVHIGLVDNTPVKPTYLKHYRRDDTVSGKYQLIDVSKLDENGEIPVIFKTDHNGFTRGDSPAIQKGKWIHFVNGHFYATTQMEVDCIEWMQRTNPQFRVYEDSGAGILTCPVVGCTAPGFVDEATLRGHLKATHGVDNA